MKRGLFVVVSGPSAAGKTTVVERLLAEVPSTVRLVTTTSRAPRPGEVNGRDYHFVTREEFIARRERGEFLEWAETYGNFYGSSRSEVDRLRASNRAVFAVVDIVGARAIKAAYPECLTVFLQPGSVEELRRRLAERPGSQAADVEKRVSRAAAEMANAADFDRVIMNRDGELDRAVEELERLVAGPSA